MRGPPLLRMLALSGMLLGSFGVLYELGHLTQLLQPRDRFVAALRGESARQVSVQPSDEDARRIERVADAIYARRGAALALDAVGLILCVLLFTGCGSALRLEAWGRSAWQIAAGAALPYQLLDTARLLLQTRDLVGVVGDPAASVRSVLYKLILLSLYSGACLVYLRRPEVAALFRARDD